MALTGHFRKIRSSLKNAEFRSAGIYTFSNFFAKGLSFLLLPVFTNPKFLSPADNGLLNLYSQSVIFVLPFVSLGIIQSAVVDYFTLDRQAFRNFCVTGLSMAFGTFLLALLGFHFFGDLLIATFDFPPLFLWAIPLLALFNFIYDFVVSIIRNQENAVKYLKMSMVKITGELALAVVLIVIFSWHWAGRVTGLLFATGATAIYGLYFLHSNGFLKGRIEKRLMISEIKFSLPVVLIQLSMFCLTSAGTFMLSALTGDNALVGIFGLSLIFGTVVTTFSHALIQYFIPKINKELASPNPDYSKLFKYLRNYTLLISGWFVLLLVIVPVVYYLFINPLYFPGIPYYFYISAGLLLWSVTYFLYRFPLFYKQKKILSFLGFFSIVLSLALNYIFISYYGAPGAAIALMVTYLLVFLLLIYFTRHHLQKMLGSKRPIPR